jgi:hypothetical protein
VCRCSETQRSLCTFVLYYSSKVDYQAGTAARFSVQRTCWNPKIWPKKVTKTLGGGLLVEFSLNGFGCRSRAGGGGFGWNKTLMDLNYIYAGYPRAGMKSGGDGAENQRVRHLGNKSLWSWFQTFFDTTLETARPGLHWVGDNQKHKSKVNGRKS